MRSTNTAERLLSLIDAPNDGRRLSAVPGGADPVAAFRREALLRLAAHALRTGGAAHDINNPTASVTANLSYLALRADDLLGIAEQLSDAAAKSQLSEIAGDLREVARESSDAMKRIAEISKSLCQPSLRTQDRSRIDLTEPARRAMRLLGQLAGDVQISVRGDPARVMANDILAGDLVLEMMLTALEDGHAMKGPVSVEIESAKSGSSVKLRVRRHGPSIGTPNEDRDLAAARRIAREVGGTVSLEVGESSYTIVAEISDAG